MQSSAKLSILTLSLMLACQGFPSDAFGKIRLAKLFCDHMVLQRDAEVPVWGWAAAGQKVQVQFRGQALDTQADADGYWKVVLASTTAGGPFEMIISGQEQQIVLKDILVGDVWLCSGQSNMEWIVADSKNARKEIANGKHDKIRHFKVPLTSSIQPEKELAGGEWQTCNPSTVGNFTAVGYYFARALQRHVDVPIGLLNASWGGSRIEPWMSAKALGYPSAKSATEAIGQQEAKRQADMLKKLTDLMGELPKKDKGLLANGQAPYAAPSLNTTDWKSMQLPGLWEQQGYKGVDGIVWFRLNIELDAEEAAYPAELGLSTIDDSDISWVNGQEVGRMTAAYNKLRTYNVPAAVLKAGQNVLAVRVEDTGGGGGIYGTAENLYLQTKRRRISLAGEWQFKVSQIQPFSNAHDNQVATKLYNKMIHPWLGFPIKGALWYQGESNTGGLDPSRYAKQMKDMITDWRQRMNCGDFPFLYVQLANFMAPDPVPTNSGWAELREAQTKVLDLKNTAQAVIIDIGEAADIHPRNKQDVGLRLSLAARKLAYGEDLVYSGPMYKSLKVEGRTVRIQFDHIGSGLKVKDPYGYLKGFALAGLDNTFVWAKARIEGNEVVVWSDAIERPTAVRYAWGNNPHDANLYNKEGLPACPFWAQD